MLIRLTVDMLSARVKSKLGRVISIALGRWRALGCSNFVVVTVVAAVAAAVVAVAVAVVAVVVVFPWPFPFPRLLLFEAGEVVSPGTGTLLRLPLPRLLLAVPLSSLLLLLSLPFGCRDGLLLFP